MSSLDYPNRHSLRKREWCFFFFLFFLLFFDSVPWFICLLQIIIYYMYSSKFNVEQLQLTQFNGYHAYDTVSNYYAKPVK